MDTFVDLIEGRAAAKPHKVIFEFLPKGLSEGVLRLDYGQLSRRARAIAVALRERNAAGQRVILPSHSSLEFITHFFGCMYAGAVAVPTPPGLSKKGWERTVSAALDCDASLVLTENERDARAICDGLSAAGRKGAIESLYGCDVADALGDRWASVKVDQDNLVFLQYTSGSTRSPRGVRVTHRNLMTNQVQIRAAMEHDEKSSFVSWLPLFHDMGLVGGLLQPLFLDSFCAFMPVGVFSRDPYLWLKAISIYRAHTSGAPNFAYQLCCDALTDEQVATLDLSSWRVAFNGAEPISPSTVKAFTRRFATIGFQPEAFFPCYGMAEATLILTGNGKSALPVFRAVDRSYLGQGCVQESTSGDNQATELIASGRLVPGVSAVILRPGTQEACGEDEVGEICVSGDNITSGYWRETASHDSFFEWDGRSYLRTGDLGFFRERHLFITGRIKDLIIIRGRNLYPQDLEASVSGVSEAFRTGGAIAFTVPSEQGEQLVVAAELKRTAIKSTDPVALWAAVSRALSLEYEVPLASLVLVKPLSLPRTTSGKLQRQRCRQLYLDGDLAAVHMVRSDLVRAETDESRSEVTSIEPETLRCLLAECLGLAADSVAATATLPELGVDSLQRARLQHAIARVIGIEITADELLCVPTIHALAALVEHKKAVGNSLSQIVSGSTRTAIPLLPQQSAVYLYCALHPNSVAYHLPLRLSLRGSLDLDALSRALSEMVKRHQLLNASVEASTEGPAFRLHANRTPEFTQIDLRSLAVNAAQVRLREHCAEESTRAFSLEQGPLARFCLIRLSEAEYVLHVVIHHLIADGWALRRIFFDDLCALYALASGETDQAAAARNVAFADYVAWLGEQGSAPRRTEQLAYWTKTLEKPLPWPIFLNEQIHADSSQTGTRYREFELGGVPFEGLAATAKQLCVSPYVVLLSCFKLALSRLTRQTDVAVGTMLLNRAHPGASEVFGFLANVAVVRTQVLESLRFAELVAAVNRSLQEATRNGEIPYADVVAAVQPERRSEASPLYRAFFVQQESPASAEVCGLAIRSEVCFEAIGARFDLEVHFWREATGFRGCLLAQERVLSSETTDMLLRDFQSLAGLVSESMNTRLHTISLGADHCHTQEQAIESALRLDARVHDCVALTLGREARTVAYAVLRDDCEVEDLRTLLPEVAGVDLATVGIVPVSHLPRTSTGAIDFASLVELPVLDTDWLQSAEAVSTSGEHSSPQPRPRLRWRRSAAVQSTSSAHVPAELIAVEETIPPTPATDVPAYADGGVLQIPEDAPKTLVAALLETARRYPEKGIHHVQHDGTVIIQRFPDLVDEARAVLAGLQQLGIEPGSNAILQFTDLRQHLASFWGCLMAGVRPAAIAVSSDYSSGNSIVKKLHSAWEVLERPPIIAADVLCDRLLSLRGVNTFAALRVMRYSSLRGNARAARLHLCEPTDVAFFQLTSGSTGIQKCIQETHRGVIAHIHSSAQFNRYESTDVSLNWLPFDHVVPILTWHLKNTYLGCEQVEVPTSVVLAEPMRWLDLIERFRATHIWSPNFGYKLVANALKEATGRRWDLSSLSKAMNAGEQVTLPVVSEFLALTTPFGVKPTVMQPSFGMAEACTCMTYTNDFDLTRSVHTFKSASAGSRLVPTTESGAGTINFIDLGPPTPGVEIRITDKKNQLVSEGVIGRFQIRGPVITPGYFNNEPANAEAFVGDGWFNSGDLGYILGGRLAITGREKEQIVMQGVNYYCYELEDVVNQIPGVIPTFSAACAVEDPDTGTESFVIFFCTTLQSAEERRRLSQQIQRALVMTMGAKPKYVIPIEKAAFPKTTSGKIQRTQLKKQLAAGEYQAWTRAQESATPEAHRQLEIFRDRWVRAEHAPTALLDGETPYLIVSATSIPVPSELASQSPVIRLHAGQVWWSETAAEPVELSSTSGASALWTRLRARFGDARRWHLVVLTASVSGEMPANSTAVERLRSDLGELLALTTTLEKPADSLASLTLVTQGAFSVCDEMAPRSEYAAFTPLLQSYAAETGIDCRHLDLETDAAFATWTAIATECRHASKENPVAFRHGARWIRQLAPVAAETSTTEASIALGQRCLLIGGLGGIGFEVAAFLLKQRSAKLLIVGRSFCGEKQERLKTLTTLGSVLTATVDVRDAVALESAVHQAEATWGASLDMAIHLAGEMQIKPTSAWTTETFMESCAAKIDGAEALARVLASRAAASVVYFSSVNARFGGAFAGAYSFANAFLHALAEGQRHAGRRAVALGWSLWDGIGMNAQPHFKAAAARRGFVPLAVPEALGALQQALAGSEASVLVGLERERAAVAYRIPCEIRPSLELVWEGASSAGGCPVVRDRLGREVRTEIAAKASMGEQVQNGADSEAKTLAVNLNAHRREVHGRLESIWRKYLKRAEIGPDQNVFDLGGSSLLLTQIQGAIAKELYPAVTLVDLFQYSTLRTLGDFLAAKTVSSASPSAIATSGCTKAKETSSDLAIIGMACRFPGADSVEEFWERLRKGEECISSLDEDALRRAGVPERTRTRADYVRRAGTLREALGFDADFFDYSPSEALAMDPQQRLLMLCCWEAIEAAGCNPFDYAGRIGLFAGTGTNTYLYHSAESGEQFLPSLEAFRLMLANDKDFAATKVSYKLGLTGPSVNVQTACSTSLVAVHLAGRSVLSGECEMALAGAATVRYPHDVGYVFQEDMILSADGHCRPFDCEAAGTVNSSGVGVVLLKRLDRALADGDPIWAVIKGTALNNDGRNKVGYTAPGAIGQTEVIAAALRAASVLPASVSYVEAHGTGTALGDPIEIRALASVFAPAQPKSPVVLGSVKGNLGHTDTASGLAGLIKVATMLKHGELVPTLHFCEASPHLGLDPRLFTVNTATRPWQTEANAPRRAGVSSFGIGGTNTHVILEEAPSRPPRAAASEHAPRVLTLSAKSPAALAALARRFVAYLQNGVEDARFADICHTTNIGRAHWEHRLACSARTVKDLASELATAADALEHGRALRPQAGALRRRYLIRDLGTSDARVQARYLRQYRPFRRAFDACVGAVSEFAGEDVLAWTLSEKAGAGACWLNASVNFACAFALAELVTAWGASPDEIQVAGVGELVGAAIGKLLSIKEAVRLFLKACAEREDTRAALPLMLAAALAQPSPREALKADASTVPLLPALASLVSPRLQWSTPVPTASADRADASVVVVDLDVTAMAECAPDQALGQILAALYRGGASLAWAAVYEGSACGRVTLPTYPFELKRFDIADTRRAKDASSVAVSTSRVLTQSLEALRVSGRLSASAENALAEIIQALVEFPTKPCLSLGEEKWERWDENPKASASSRTLCLLLTLGQTSMPECASVWRATGLEVIWMGAASAETLDLDQVRRTIVTQRDQGSSVRIVLRSQQSAMADADAETALHAAWSAARVLRDLARLSDELSVRLAVTLVDAGLEEIPQADLAACALLGAAKALMWERPCLAVQLIELDDHADTTAALGRMLCSDEVSGHFRVVRGVCTVPKVVPQSGALTSELTLSSDGVYLITGGTGSLGLNLAEWLVARGARRLMLVSRRAPTAAASTRLSELTRVGAQCRTIEVDISSDSAVKRVFDEVASGGAPLRGIFHLAAVLADEATENLSEAGFRATLASKACSAYCLDKYSRHLRIDHFVLFSSIVSTFGSPGQASYVAANSYLDRLAAARRAAGLPGLAIGWGPWAGTAMTARALRLASLGLKTLLSDDALAALGRFASAQTAQVLVFDTDTAKLRIVAEAHPFVGRMLASIIPKLASTDASAASAGQHSVLAELSALPPGQRGAAVQEIVRREVAQLLSLPLEEVDADRGFNSLGLDSLMAMTLIDTLEDLFGQRVAATTLFNYPSCARLAARLEALVWPPSAPGADVSVISLQKIPEIETDFVALIEQEFKSTLGN